MVISLFMGNISQHSTHSGDFLRFQALSVIASTERPGIPIITKHTISSSHATLVDTPGVYKPLTMSSGFPQSWSHPPTTTQLYPSQFFERRSPIPPSTLNQTHSNLHHGPNENYRFRPHCRCRHRPRCCLRLRG
jgi:hypothetical protein